MEWVLRIMSNLLRPDELGPAEAAYRLLEKLVAFGQSPETAAFRVRSAVPRRRAIASRRL